MKNLSNIKLAYLVSRIAMGLSLLMHGGIRIPKWAEFAESTASSFSETVLPHGLVYGFASVIIVVEVLSGLFLLFGGIFVRIGCAIGILLMGALMFGSGLIENWQAVSNQIIHVIVLYLLLINKHTFDPSADQSVEIKGLK